MSRFQYTWLLSELSRAAASAILANNNNTLIFPDATVVAPANNKDVTYEPASVANKIVAILETDDINKQGSTLKQTVFARLVELRNSAFNSIADWEVGDKALAEQQVEALLEVYWAAVPFPEDKNTRISASCSSR